VSSPFALKSASHCLGIKGISASWQSLSIAAQLKDSDLRNSFTQVLQIGRTLSGKKREVVGA
jgi:hypothetical protein